MTSTVTNAINEPPSVGLLGPADPPPFEIVSHDRALPILLVCDHAGREMPRALGDLGLASEDLEKHIAWDIGAEKVARIVADLLPAHLVLQPYSRLVVDCNRPVDADDFIPVSSDGIAVPGNEALSGKQRDDRITGIFRPFDEAVERLISKPDIKAAFAIHSFTPQLSDGPPRQMHFGICSRTDPETALKISSEIRRQDAGLIVEVDQPYQIDDTSDWFVPRHCEPRGLIHSLIEIRNDLLRDDAGCRRAAQLLTTALCNVTGARS